MDELSGQIPKHGQYLETGYIPISSEEGKIHFGHYSPPNYRLNTVPPNHHEIALDDYQDLEFLHEKVAWLAEAEYLTEEDKAMGAAYSIAIGHILQLPEDDIRQALRDASKRHEERHRDQELQFQSHSLHITVDLDELGETFLKFTRDEVTSLVIQYHRLGSLLELDARIRGIITKDKPLEYSTPQLIYEGSKAITLFTTQDDQECELDDAWQEIRESGGMGYPVRVPPEYLMLFTGDPNIVQRIHGNTIDQTSLYTLMRSRLRSVIRNPNEFVASLMDDGFQELLRQDMANATTATKDVLDALVQKYVLDKSKLLFYQNYG